jgi:molybdopterin biosynthesis enzyme
MDAYSDSVQRIARLTPLGDVLAIIARVSAVLPQEVALASGIGRTLARDVVARRALPEAAVALRDGFAVAAELIGDAGPYAPVPLPGCGRIDSGEPLPHGCDAVAPLDAVTHSGLGAAAVAPVGAGEGVLPPGGDVPVGGVLARAGERVTRTRLAALAACGVTSIGVRVPRVRLCRAAARQEFVTASYDLISAAVEVSGAAVVHDPARECSVSGLEAALNGADADAVIAIGGTGSGRGDASVSTLQRRGQIEAHGIGISPGETATFGFVGAQPSRRPVLLVPGRFDAALAVWLLLGLPLLRRLAGGTEEEPAFGAKLKRKVSSTLGLAELVPVRRCGGDGDEVEPLARAHLPLAALSDADGWILVPAASEGFAAGATVKVRPFP